MRVRDSAEENGSSLRDLRLLAVGRSRDLRLRVRLTILGRYEDIVTRHGTTQQRSRWMLRFRRCDERDGLCSRRVPASEESPHQRLESKNSD